MALPTRHPSCQTSGCPHRHRDVLPIRQFARDEFRKVLNELALDDCPRNPLSLQITLASLAVPILQCARDTPPITARMNRLDREVTQEWRHHIHTPLTTGTGISGADAGVGIGAITLSISDGGVGTQQLANNAVTAAKIIANAITSTKIVDDAVVTAKIADDAVVTAALDDAAVTTAKVADAAIATGKIANDAITSAKIADDATEM